jgi:hypothetical protein
MATLKTFLILLAFGMMFLTSQAGKVVVNPGDDLDALLNSSKGGDTILVKSHKKSTFAAKMEYRVLAYFVYIG